MGELLDLLESNGPYLFRLLYRVTLREDAAEDLLQELFLKLQASDGFHSAKNRLAYARRTALHLAFDWRRSQRSSPNVALPQKEAASSDLPPLLRLIEDEEIQSVLDAMAGLSPSNAELLTMRYLQQDSYDAIAAHLGKTNHQARALCRKALVQLRELVTEKQRGDAERERS